MERICKDHNALIIRSFQKCGITVALDGSEDHNINIQGLNGYIVGLQAIELEESASSDSSDTESEPDIVRPPSHIQLGEEIGCERVAGTMVGTVAGAVVGRVAGAVVGFSCKLCVKKVTLIKEVLVLVEVLMIKKVTENKTLR